MASSAEGETRRRTVGIVAGEASGDLLGSQLIMALREFIPRHEFIGIGGPLMEGAGMEVLFPLEKLAVRGYIEVLRHFAEIVWIRRQLRRRFIANPPDVFIGIDAPDFNLDLELSLKAHGIPTVHYVSPAIWMWRKKRIHKIRQAVSRMLTLFPFEEPLYRQAGVDAAFVGHPLADLLDQVPRYAAAREQLKLPPSAPVIALLPGSHQSELEHMADLFIQTTKQIRERIPQTIFLAPLTTRKTRLMFKTTLYHNQTKNLPLTILFKHTHNTISTTNIILITSSTTTLKTTLLNKPIIITYKIPTTNH